MCWNQHVSLNTFLFSTFMLCLMIYNDNFTPYKINYVNNVYVYFFILSFSLMQLIEYFIWRNLDNVKITQRLSLVGQILLLIQPIASLLLLNNLILKQFMIFLYSIPALIFFVLSKKNYKTTVLNGHLKWEWMPSSDIMFFIWLFFLLFSLIINGYYKYLIAVLFLFMITFISNYNNGTGGSLWCWSINFFMIIFAIYLLIILPFIEHGIC